MYFYGEYARYERRGKKVGKHDCGVISDEDELNEQRLEQDRQRKRDAKR